MAVRECSSESGEVVEGRYRSVQSWSRRKMRRGRAMGSGCSGGRAGVRRGTVVRPLLRLLEEGSAAVALGRRDGGCDCGLVEGRGAASWVGESEAREGRPEENDRRSRSVLGLSIDALLLPGDDGDVEAAGAALTPDRPRPAHTPASALAPAPSSPACTSEACAAPPAIPLICSGNCPILCIKFRTPFCT